MKNRELCDYVKTIVNLTPNQIDEFICICIDTFMHSVASTFSEKTDGKLKYVDIEVPYIGYLTANIGENGKLENANIRLYDDLVETLSLAVTEFKSPLICRAESVITKQIAEKYRSLL